MIPFQEDFNKTVQRNESLSRKHFTGQHRLCQHFKKLYGCEVDSIGESMRVFNGFGIVSCGMVITSLGNCLSRTLLLR